MWWHDITEIKEWINRVSDKLVRIDLNMEKLLGESQDRSVFKAAEDIKESLEDAFCSDNEYSSINRIHDKLNALVKDADRQQSVLLAEKTLDKFEDYMKNIDKLNVLINEFKGCVSMARSAISERKELDKEFEEMKKVTKISQQIYDGMLSFIKASENLEQKKYFKIDAIYAAICEKEVKLKPKRKPAKKKVTPSP